MNLSEELIYYAKEYLSIVKEMANPEHDEASRHILSAQRTLAHDELIRLTGLERPFDMVSYCREIIERENKPRIGDWMQTASGIAFYPLDPRPEEIHIEDIAHALSMQCRYGGHSKVFYSVAEHSCYVSDYCSEENKLWGLLHDASEAYLQDVIRPIKPSLTNYKEIEDRLMAVICERFGLPLEMPAEVKEMDWRILHNEKAQVMGAAPREWSLTGEPLPKLNIMCLNPIQAEEDFLYTFRILNERKRWFKV